MSIEPRNAKGLGHGMPNATMVQMSNADIAALAVPEKLLALAVSFLTELAFRFS
jgi:hypothetical protein